MMRNITLPLEIVPSSWLPWPSKGKGFRLDATTLTIFEGQTPRLIPLSQVEEVKLERGNILVALKSGEILHLATDNHPQEILEIFTRVIAEQRQWEVWQNESLTASATMDAIDRLVNAVGDPWVRATELLIKLAVHENATDLHLEPLQGCTRVTMRGGGFLGEVGTFDSRAHAGIVARLKHLAGCHPHLSGMPQEGAWTIDSNSGIEGRLAVFPSLNGERVSVRFVRPLMFPTLESLGWPKSAIIAWRRLLSNEGSGLFLVTGPVGSGKTTALYATLAEIAASDSHWLCRNHDISSAHQTENINQNSTVLNLPQQPRRVMTLEDPVEGKVPGICQASLDLRAGLDLASAFKHLLRQDPDVMALGEIRDPACLREVLQAGLAGHLVLATFHAASPAAALDRMRQMGVATELIGCGLRGMVGLRWANSNNERKLKPAVTVVALKFDAASTSLHLQSLVDAEEEEGR